MTDIKEQSDRVDREIDNIVWSLNQRLDGGLMIDDKETRLTCLRLAKGEAASPLKTAEQVIEDAQKFFDFIKGEQKEAS